MTDIRPDPRALRAIRWAVDHDPEERRRFRALMASIERHGVCLPLIIDGGGHLLDGFHRLIACERLGLDPPVLRLDRADALDLVLCPGHERSRPIRFEPGQSRVGEP